MNISKKQNVAIQVTPDNITPFAEWYESILGTVGGSNPIYGAYLVDRLAETKLPFETISEPAKLKSCLQYLDRKMDAVKKSLTFFDTYNIRGSVTTDTITSLVAQMPLNSSLVVQDDQIPWNGEVYYKGDIIVKDFQGNIHHIESESSGYYYPKSVTLVGDTPTTAMIEYAFTTEVPIASTFTFSSTATVAVNPYATMKVTELEVSSDTQTYNITETILAGSYGSYHAFYAPGTSGIVAPIVYAYVCDESNNKTGERIFFDNMFEFSGTSSFRVYNSYTKPIYVVIK